MASFLSSVFQTFRNRISSPKKTEATFDEQRATFIQHVRKVERTPLGAWGLLAIRFIDNAVKSKRLTAEQAAEAFRVASNILKQKEDKGSRVIINFSFKRSIEEKLSKMLDVDWNLRQQSALFQAIEKDIKRVNGLIMANPQLVHARNERGQTPLHYAIEINEVEVVELLIHQGAKVHVKDGLGETPLDYTIVRQDVDYELAKLLFNTMLLQNYGKDGFDNLGRPKDKILDGFGRHIYNAITTAVNAIEQEEAINAFRIAMQILQLEECLKSKTIKSIPKNIENKLLSLYEDLYVCFSATRDDSTSAGRTHLLSAFKCSPYLNRRFLDQDRMKAHFDVLNILNTGERILDVGDIRAAIRVKRGKGKDSLGVNENPHYKERNDSIEDTNSDMNVKLLSEDSAKKEEAKTTNEYLDTSVFPPRIVHSEEAEKLYYEATGRTPLYVAVENGDLEKVKELGENHPRYINIADDKSRTPLHVAIEHNQFEIAEFLIGNGAKVNAKDFLGKTPLDYAVEQKVIALLEKNGATNGATEVPTISLKKEEEGEETHGNDYDNISEREIIDLLEKSGSTNGATEVLTISPKKEEEEEEEENHGNDDYDNMSESELADIEQPNPTLVSRRSSLPNSTGITGDGISELTKLLETSVKEVRELPQPQLPPILRAIDNNLLNRLYTFWVCSTASCHSEVGKLAPTQNSSTLGY